ncbi:MAG: recombinase family protein [Polyangiales bacterium]
MIRGSRFVIYARKSTDRDDNQVMSIPSQLDEVRRVAARHGITPVAEVTEAWSAREQGRPAFGKLLKDIEAGRVDGILAWKLDRLARNPIDGAMLADLLGKGRLREIVTTEGVHDGSGASKLLLAILFGVATKYTDDLIEVIRRANRTIHERGRITWKPPLGYMKVREGAGYRGAGKVVRDPARFGLVLQLFRAALTGTVTAADLWRLARDIGLTSRGSRRFKPGPITASYIYSLLQNSFYSGVIDRGDAQFKGEHEPMVTAAEFQRVQQLLRRKDAPRPKSAREFLFRGLLRCADCGGALSGERHVKRTGLLFVYYRCGHRKLGKPRCGQRAPREDAVLGDVLETVEALSLTPEIAAWTLDAVDIMASRGRADAESERARLATQLDDVNRRIGDLTDILLERLISNDDFRARKVTLDEQRVDLERQLADPIAGLEAWQHTITETVTTATDIFAAFVHATTDERRELFARICQNCTVSKGKATPALRTPFGSLLVQPRGVALPKVDSQNRKEMLARVLAQTENAPVACSELGAYLPWWTSLWDVRTQP